MVTDEPYRCVALTITIVNHDVWFVASIRVIDSFA